uniref:Retrovirus-related Pol polyprotein from transposon TNT 1-94-like beta-barrel domain-containing protein n=1 Tax=Cannabis sativa TaxID=3483 RepID=A0A803PV09_CANSA
MEGQFTNIQKGSLSIFEYVDNIQSTSDALSVARSPVDDQDLVLQLLNGLGLEFDSVVSGITSRSDALTIEEVQALLLSHESRLEHHQFMTDLVVKMEANLTFGNGRSDGVPPYSNSKNPQHDVTQLSTGRGRGYPKYNQQSVICQVCLRSGHTIPVCHYYFDKNWVVSRSNQSARAHLVEVDSKYDPQAHSTTLVQDFGDDSCWYAEIGATAHITFDATNLDNQHAYNGPKTLVMGDGKKFLISHVGNSTLPSYNPSCPRQLQSVLQVPSITKNFISVSKLVDDNGIFLEFHKNYCFVKDKQT